MAALDENPPKTWGINAAGLLVEVANYLLQAKIINDDQDRFDEFIRALIWLKRWHEEQTTK